MSGVSIPSDRIEVELEGRQYGTHGAVEGKFLQAVPWSFQEFAAGIRQQSALLALAASPELEKQAIFDAYAKDLAVLERYVSEFEACAKQAIRSSIADRRDTTDHEHVEKTWQQLKDEIPPLGRTPLLQLPYTRAAKEAETLLAELKAEFEDAVQRVLQLFTFWFHRLVERELVGLVEWAALDVCRFHYFRHERTDTVLDERTRVEKTVERTRLMGQRTEERTIRERLVRRELFRERHVHHIVNAKLYRLDEYPERVPARVREFLNAVPVWLRTCLQIVDGQMTMEEVLRRKTSEGTVIESEVRAVYRYCPGVLLAPFNLIGWSADDLADTRSGGARARSGLRGFAGEIGWVAGPVLMGVGALMASRAGAIGWVLLTLGAVMLGLALYSTGKRTGR